ncbi:MAG: glycosyltransferase [Deltaproteobacteria bacterium]|nr:glycosyltransferase [Deltaproteobacteria bacterium]
MKHGHNIAFFASSLVSAYWNGAATYYRGIIKGLDDLGYSVTFYEPDAYDRQKHRDIADPSWARVHVYKADENGLGSALKSAKDADILIKASGVGVFDERLEAAILDIKKNDAISIFWDVDAPATLDRVKNNPDDAFAPLIPKYDLILTYGGGYPVIDAYKELGAKDCVPIYNALDPATHFPVDEDSRYRCDLGFLGNRMPDREERIREFFFKAAKKMPEQEFMLGGNGWDEPGIPNITYLGHVYTREHNSFNSSAKAVLNVNRESMARYGFSPPTRIFEAAGAGSCIITDSWKGIEMFLTPGEEVLVADSGDEVAELLGSLTPERAKEIGTAAYKRILAEHTYSHRARQLESILRAIR